MLIWEHGFCEDISNYPSFTSKLINFPGELQGCIYENEESGQIPGGNIIESKNH